MEAAIPPALHGQGASMKTIPNQTPPFFRQFSNYSTPTYVVVVLFVAVQRSKLHTDSAEVPVLHTPVMVAKVRFSMACSFVDGRGKRGNVHIQAIMSVAFPNFVVFDGFI